MAEEFVIKSQQIEDKINQLLPSQGGFQAGVDFSASTMVIPIVDLTETAEGSALRQDLQSSLSHKSITTFDVSNTTSTIINTTGYFRIFGTFGGRSSANNTGNFSITDGTTSKKFLEFNEFGTANANNSQVLFDFIIKLTAGDSVTATTDIASCVLAGSTRQIADLQGNLVNP